MNCPFLTEGRARYCHAAPVRKLILDAPAVAGGRCTSREYWQCELAGKNAAKQDRCPDLEEVQVQYCGASPVTKLVPSSDSQLSSCTSGSYRYCEFYLARSRPRTAATPARLLYAANHFWLDVDDSGLCHVGVDDLLAEVAGSVEGVVFATPHGTCRPAMTLTVDSVEWPMFFPNPMTIQKVNHRVRSDPARVTADPYGTGWLFEGCELPGITRSGLISGTEAESWRIRERSRLTHEIQEIHAPACDGSSVRGVARLLPRPELVCMFQHFFSDRCRWEE